MTKTMEEQAQYKKGLWTEEEDKILVEYVEVHGKGQWNHIAKKTGLKRCGKSCRLRWMNYLSPSIKRGSFTEEEEDLIIRLHNLLGNRWSLIAKRVPGRTDNQVKNYWNTHLSKKLAAKEHNGRLGIKEQRGRLIIKEQFSRVGVSKSTNSRTVGMSQTATNSDRSPGVNASATIKIAAGKDTEKVFEVSDTQEANQAMIMDSCVNSFWISHDSSELSSLSMEFLDGYSFDFA